MKSNKVNGSNASTDSVRVLIVGAGIAGLTLALQLEQAGIECQVFEAAPEISAMGVGINILPHASKVLADLGLESELSRVAVLTERSLFYNRFGQLIYEEPLGTKAGYEHPQYSIHRGDLQAVLLRAVVDRIGPVTTDAKLIDIKQNVHEAESAFVSSNGSQRSVRSSVVVGCDGIHSVVRKQLHPTEGEPRYSGVNMWRGTVPWNPIVGGAAMIRAGWLTTGKMVVYPIRNNVDGNGLQLVNWVAELETSNYLKRDWSRQGRLEDFAHAFSSWRFDWLDFPDLIESTPEVLEYPMVDQDPLAFWTDGRITLLGDAAHPMVPRGSNGAGQAILDAVAFRQSMSRHKDPQEALLSYEAERRPATAAVVMANRSHPPDAILREVYNRTKDRPFRHIDDVISAEELRAVSESYKQVAGYSISKLAP